MHSYTETDETTITFFIDLSGDARLESVSFGVHLYADVANCSTSSLGTLTTISF